MEVFIKDAPVHNCNGSRRITLPVAWFREHGFELKRDSVAIYKNELGELILKPNIKEV